MKIIRKQFSEEIALYVFLLLFITIVFPAHGEIISPELKVQGNKKTRITYIQYLVNDCLEELRAERWQNLSSDELSQCILNSKLFSEVVVEIDDPVIQVTVKERWTIIPIPFLRVEQDNNTAGLFFMDTHFLGMGKHAAIGGTVGDRGETLFLSYSDSAINFSKWTASFFLVKDK